MNDSTKRPTKPGVFDMGNGHKGIALDLSDIKGSMALIKELPVEGLIALIATLHTQAENTDKLGKFVMGELLRRAAADVAREAEGTNAADPDTTDDAPTPSATQPDLFAVEPVVGGH